jgi:hypothetical protein
VEPPTHAGGGLKVAAECFACAGVPYAAHEAGCPVGLEAWAAASWALAAKEWAHLEELERSAGMQVGAWRNLSKADWTASCAKGLAVKASAERRAAP